jgi:Protein of unknown function (DUF1553)/Protein of unknown function (DUF1549)
MTRRSTAATQWTAVLWLIAVGVSAIAGPVAGDEFSETEITEVPIADSDRTHWAFRPIHQPPLPTVSDANIVHPIDRFIAARLQSEHLQLQPPAERRTLLRRLWFDLIGLPPSPEPLAQFAGPESSVTWQQLIDELLARPEYGERWAQHWLDVARFADTDGFEHDKVRPEAWTYRDWVIDAFNADLPYDQFIRLQIAGDEVSLDDSTASTATRFCLSGPDMPDINSQDERRHTLLNELTATIGSALLGVQLGCAQCHDHKYDPISQADFYRIRAVFEPAVHFEKNKSVTNLEEKSDDPGHSYLWLRGDFRRRGPEVAPGILRVAAGGTVFTPVTLKHSSGRRLAFANWLVSKDNPLTARVIVNRVWQHHFGTGLCDTPGDFGYIGSTPTHEALLDWLSAEFMDSGWSLKQLHRLVLTSATWQQRSYLPASSSVTAQHEWEQAFAADPDARLLSRYPRRRLEGEAVRDAMLAAAGMLNFKRGGPGVMPPLPPELASTLLRKQWEVTKDEAEHNRRSVYVFARRNLRYPIFDAFDRPDANSSCSVRNVSTTAPQSLYLLNSEFSHRVSRQMASMVVAETTQSTEVIDQVFSRILGRSASDVELSECGQLLNEAGFAAASDSAVAELCLVLFNSNEFVYLD